VSKGEGLSNPAPITRSGVAILVASLVVLVTTTGGVPADTKSSPVTVVNPAISPVPTTVGNPATSPALVSRVDDPGRSAYQSVLSDSDAHCEPFGLLCIYNFPAVPQGHRLVIQHISYYQSVETGDTGSVSAEIISTQGNLTLSYSSTEFSNPTHGQISLNQPVLIYIEGGDAPEVRTTWLGSATVILPFGGVTLTGYLLDCTFIPCAAVAH
jgi:hypothetical protein